MPEGPYPIILSRQDGQVVLDGELTFPETGPGGLPAWFQTGAGDPVTANPTVPNTVGGLYFDTSGASGLWSAAGPASADWVPLGNTDSDPGTGLVYTLNSPGNVNVNLGAQGDGAVAGLVSGGGASVMAEDAEIVARLPDNTKFKVLLGGALSIPSQPTVSAPAYAVGGMYYDTTLHKLRIGGAAGWETVTSV